MESIHQRIKRLREEKGLSQESLAAAVGVSYQSVQEWERANGTAPSRKRQAKVAEVLGVSMTELMTGHGATAGEFTEHEKALIARYRAADPRWQLTLRLLAALATEDQIEAATDVNVIIARIIGKKPADVRYALNERVAEAYGSAPHVSRRTPLVNSRSERQGTANSNGSATRNRDIKTVKGGKS